MKERKRAVPLLLWDSWFLDFNSEGYLRGNQYKVGVALAKIGSQRGRVLSILTTVAGDRAEGHGS